MLLSQIMHAHYQRTYGIGLAIAILFNCIFCALSTNDNTLAAESASFARELAALARRATIYRPIGSGYLILCLAAAWGGTTDPQMRSTLESVMDDYQQDFRLHNPINIRSELEWIAQHMRLGLPAR